MPERKGPRITRVYTKTGDGGFTGLTGGQRVPKDNARIVAYGTVDELSASLGLVGIEIEAEKPAFNKLEEANLLHQHIIFIQNQLFTLGGDLATRLEDRHPMMPITGELHVDYLERLCDSYNSALKPLSDFIIPGGTRTAVALHMARTICRRAERMVYTLSKEEPVGDFILNYLNRLSDALFVLARVSNAFQGIDEKTWNRVLDEPEL